MVKNPNTYIEKKQRNHHSTGFRVLLGGLLFIVSTGMAHAGWLGIGAPRIPADLRALFVEAENEFELKTLRDMPEPERTKIYWVDNHRLIYTVRKFNGWEAREDERSKVIIYDVDTEKSEETPYRGTLRCLGTEGQILVQDYPVPYPVLRPGESKGERRYYLAGILGKELTRFKMPEDESINVFSCQPYSIRNHNFGEYHYLRTLRRSDGVIDDGPDYTFRLISPDGTTQWSVDNSDICGRVGELNYLAWSNKYFMRVTFGVGARECGYMDRRSWLFSTTSAEPKSLPILIQEAGRKQGAGLIGSGETYWARPGMFTLVLASTNRLLDGLYWSDEQSGKLKRILKIPVGIDQLSPDGCRNLVLTKPPAVLELCTGIQQ